MSELGQGRVKGHGFSRAVIPARIVILRERDGARQPEEARPKDLLLGFSKQVLRLPALTPFVRAALRMTIGRG